MYLKCYVAVYLWKNAFSWKFFVHCIFMKVFCSFHWVNLIGKDVLFIAFRPFICLIWYAKWIFSNCSLLGINNRNLFRILMSACYCYLAWLFVFYCVFHLLYVFVDQCHNLLYWKAVCWTFCLPAKSCAFFSHYNYNISRFHGWAI